LRISLTYGSGLRRRLLSLKLYKGPSQCDCSLGRKSAASRSGCRNHTLSPSLNRCPVGFCVVKPSPPSLSVLRLIRSRAKLCTSFKTCLEVSALFVLLRSMMKVYPEGDQTAGHKGDEDPGQKASGMGNIRSRERRCGTPSRKRGTFWSQSCWFLETISERLFRMTPFNTARDRNFFPDPGMVEVEEVIPHIIDIHVLRYGLRYGEGLPDPWNGVHFGPFREVVHGNK
ncbi:hypothetical protein TNCV_1500781, partial [Trichonephila clavipes]